MPDELSEVLRRGAGAAQPGWGFDDVWRRSRRQRARNTGLKGIAAVGIFIVVAAGVPLIRSNQGADDRRIAPVGKATWQRIPDAPIEGRYGNIAVWTGEEMLIWGGATDGTDGFAGLTNGAAFNPGTQAWRHLSDGPLEFSSGRTAVWTGEAMVVWGGERGDGSHARPDNGAAYDPRTDTWKDLPRSPYWSLASHSAIWTGDEMLVWGGVGMEDRGAAFDPRSGAWRTIASAPIEGRFRHATVWTGTEMIVWGGAAGGGGEPLATGAAYDPDADSWRRLPRAPLSKRDSPAAVWTGDEMIVWGGWSEDEGGRVDGAAYDPATDDWREIPRAPVSGGLSASPVACNGQQMVVVGDGGEVATYSPTTNAWATLPDPPAGKSMSPSLVAQGDEVVLWGGADPSVGGFSSEGAVLRLSTAPENEEPDEEEAQKEDIDAMSVTVFLKDAVERTERRSLVNRFAEIDGIASYAFVSKEEAFERFKKQYEDQPEYWANLPEDALPAYFIVELSDQADISRVVKLLEELGGVEVVRYPNPEPAARGS